MKRLIRRFSQWRKKLKLVKQIRAFLNGQSPQVFLDVSGSMECYVIQNKVDVNKILKTVFKISPFMLWGLSHELVHLKTVLRKENTDDLIIDWGGGTDGSLLSDIGNPVIFITDDCPSFSERPQVVKLLILCISKEINVPDWAKSLSINISEIF